MAKDVIIIPGDGDIQFNDGQSILSARIQLDDNNNLIVSNAQGDLILGTSSTNVIFGNILNSSSDTDKFLVSENGILKYRTGAQLRSDIGAQASGTYNTIIGTDTDINTSGATIIDSINVTDGVITSMGTRTLTPADIGAQVAGTYDNYVGWSLQTDNTDRGSITSSEIVNFVGGNNVTIDYTAENNTITINSTDTNTDTNTTYSVKASTQTGGAGIDLDAGGSGSGTDTVKILGSGATTVTRTDASTITISSTDTNTLPNNATITISAGSGLTTGGSFTTNQEIDGSITLSHADTSTQGSVNNSNGTVIQDVTLDGFGHITSLGSVNLDNRFILSSTKGVAGGIATLDDNGLVPTSQLPSYVDDILEFETFDEFPDTGETGKIYVDLETNNIYRWSGSSYIQVNNAVSTADNADKLDNQHGTYYLDYNNFTNKPTIPTVNNGELTLSTSGIASGSATFTANQSGGSTFTVSVPGTNLAMGGSADARTITSSTGTNVTIPVGTTTNSGFISISDKAKLDGIDDGANNYTHPTHPGDDINIDTGTLTGATVISDLDFNITTDNLGHVTDANAVVSTRNLTAANIGAEPAFSKNEAFNKNFGSVAGTVAQGNDSRINNGQTAYSWGNHASQGYLTDISIPILNGEDAEQFVLNNGRNLKFVGDGSTSISFNPTDNSVTISSTDTNTDTNNYVSSVAFSTSNGVLTLNRLGLSALTVDLDGRYELSGTNDNYGGWTLYTDNTSRGTISSSEVVNFVGGSNVSLSYSSTNNTITINSTDTNTDTNTTYSVKASTQTGGAGIDLDAGGSGSGTDTVKILGSGATTVTRTDASTITISSVNTVPNNATITISAGSGLTTGGSFTTNQEIDGSITLAHDDTSSQGSVNNSNGTVIQDVTLDGFGHITSLGSVNLDGRYILASTKGIPGGVASLDDNGLVPSSQLPSYVDDILEYDNFGEFPGTGETGKIYVDLESGDIYRWGGSEYIQVNNAVSTADNADKLDNQQGTYYLDYNNFTNTPTIGDSTITITAGGGLTTGGSFTTNQISDGEITINHADTSSFGMSALTGASVISDINVDTYGHVTSVSTRNLTPGDIGAQPAGSYDNYLGWTLYTDGTTRGTISSSEVVNLVGGSNVSLNYSATNNTITISSTDTTPNNATISISAGSGLTNGGDFTTNQSSAETITLNVGAGSGISVSADAVAVDSTVVRTSVNQTIAGEKTLTDKLTIEGSVAGATIFDVQGTSGQLFSITDTLVGDIFTVNDISGIPILTVNSNDLVTVDGQLTIVDGTQGANKVFTSDANGLGSWQTLNTSYFSDFNTSTAVINDTLRFDGTQWVNNEVLTNDGVTITINPSADSATTPSLLITSGGSISETNNLELNDLGSAANNTNKLNFTFTGARLKGATIEAIEKGTNNTDGSDLVLYTYGVGEVANDNQLYLRRNGNVGIGIDPTYKLDVDGIVYVRAVNNHIRLEDTDHTSDIWSVGLNGQQFQIRNINAGTNVIRLNDDAIANAITATSVGVGIGLTSPTHRLHSSGDILANGSLLKNISIASGDEFIVGLEYGSSAEVGLHSTIDVISPYRIGLKWKTYKQNVGEFEAMYLSHSGSLTVNEDLFIKESFGNLDTSAQTGIRFESASTTLQTALIYSDNYRIYFGGTSGAGETVRFQQGGNVGIGLTPTYKLHVDDTIASDYGFRITGTDADYLMYNNSGTNAIYLRDMNASQTKVAWTPTAMTIYDTLVLNDVATDNAELSVLLRNGSNQVVTRELGSGAFTSAYSHPTHPGDDINLDTGALTGATVISDLDFNITTDTSGHVTDANASFSTRNLTAADIGAAASSHTHTISQITDSTTVGQNMVKLTNPSAVTFLQINANNTVSALDAATFRTAIGAGTGTVTSVSGAGSVNGITLTGTVTSSGSLTLGGSLSGITVAQLDGAAVITSAEIFSNVDTALMTAAAIEDKILSYGYTTATGDITGVGAGDGLTGGGAGGNVTLHVGAGDGISVDANTVAVDSTVVRTSGNQTISDTKTFSGQLNLSAASAKLQFTGTGTKSITTNINDLYIEPGSRGVGISISNGFEAKLHVNGDYGSNGISIYATHDIIAFSDASVKTNIRQIENPLDRVINSRGVLYDRTDTDSKDNIGFIAQELEQQFPELVYTQTDGKKAVKYQNAVAVLFEAIKEQQTQIEEIKKLLDK